MDRPRRIKCFVNEAEKEERHPENEEQESPAGVLRAENRVIKQQPESHYGVPLKSRPAPSKCGHPAYPNTTTK